MPQICALTWAVRCLPNNPICCSILQLQLQLQIRNMLHLWWQFYCLSMVAWAKWQSTDRHSWSNWAALPLPASSKSSAYPAFSHLFLPHDGSKDPHWTSQSFALNPAVSRLEEVSAPLAPMFSNKDLSPCCRSLPRYLLPNANRRTRPCPALSIIGRRRRQEKRRSRREELRKQEKDGLMVDSDSSSEEETCQEINRLPKTMWLSPGSTMRTTSFQVTRKTFTFRALKITALAWSNLIKSVGSFRSQGNSTSSIFPVTIQSTTTNKNPKTRTSSMR